MLLVKVTGFGRNVTYEPSQIPSRGGDLHCPSKRPSPALSDGYIKKMVNIRTVCGSKQNLYINILTVTNNKVTMVLY